MCIPGEAMKETSCPDSLLRPGSLIGSWRVEGYAGRGTYGAVYRARHASEPDAPLVALKVAVFPGDPRFLRERELLARTHHPAAPRLLDWGGWVAGSGASHPYLVLEWVPGLPLELSTALVLKDWPQAAALTSCGTFLPRSGEGACASGCSWT